MVVNYFMLNRDSWIMLHFIALKLLAGNILSSFLLHNIWPAQCKKIKYIKATCPDFKPNEAIYLLSTSFVVKRKKRKWEITTNHFICINRCIKQRHIRYLQILYGFGNSKKTLKYKIAKKVIYFRQGSNPTC